KERNRSLGAARALLAMGRCSGAAAQRRPLCTFFLRACRVPPREDLLRGQQRQGVLAQGKRVALAHSLCARRTAASGFLACERTAKSFVAPPSSRSADEERRLLEIGRHASARARRGRLAQGHTVVPARLLHAPRDAPDRYLVRAGEMPACRLDG